MATETVCADGTRCDGDCGEGRNGLVCRRESSRCRVRLTSIGYSKYYSTISLIAILASSLVGLHGAEPSTGSHDWYAGWSEYGGSPESAQYSSLRQINRENVSKLALAWSYEIGDKSRYAFAPLEAHGVVYAMAKGNAIVALEATTGRELWVHPTDAMTRLITNRGINYWESKDGRDRRLLLAVNNMLQAIDARSGKPIGTFGKFGLVDLREGLGRDPQSVVLVQSLTPGRVFEDLLILGSATNQEYESAPGDVRAFDVRTGKQVWSFHTVPHPGEVGYDTWPPDAWKTVGGANAWGEVSVDPQRGIVYIPTGSPKYNFYGANRPGANLFGDCILALDARSGKRLWHYQMVHHDIWDYDNETAPKLLTVKHDGKNVDAVAVVGKEGFVWVFDRVTGTPLWPVEERPVPKSDVPGEQTWPTQPFPLKPPPFARQKFTADDLSPYLEPGERAQIKDEMLSARNEGLFTPPGTRNTVQMPGNNGGANWGGAAIDPASGRLYVVSKDLPAMLKLEKESEIAAPENGSAEEKGWAVYQNKCQVCHHADLKGQPPAVPSLVNVGDRLKREQVEGVVVHGQGLMPGFGTVPEADRANLVAFLYRQDRVNKSAGTVVAKAGPQEARYRSGFGFMYSKGGLSPIKPPWTSLTAYDLNQGTIEWSLPLGEVPELAAKGIHNTGTHFPKVGPVVTAGGLIFTGTRDGKVRALDQRNGAVLWEADAPAPLEGIPAVYEEGGREFVVFCAAAGKMPNGSPEHGAYIAFSLPALQ